MIPIRVLIITACLVFIAQPSLAQVEQSYLDVDGIAMPLMNFTDTPGTSADGRSIHNLNATGLMRVAFGVVPLLIEKMSSASNAKGGSVMTVRIFRDGDPTEVRQYAGVTISELRIGELNKQSQEQLLIQIHMVSRTANSTPGGSTDLVTSGFDKDLLSEGFDLRVDNLPDNVIRTKSLSIVPCSGAGCVMMAALEIAVSGEKRTAWNEWLTTNPTTLRTAQMRLRNVESNVTFGKFLLYDMRPISYAEIESVIASEDSEDAPQPEANVVLSVGKVYLK
ncbi:MAG: hypothetical protein H7X80_05170 [bacterium]|nr:hypothetical protein [Candidatus Kapabacteria bacterium]